ncbi:hypothetical protein ACIG87_15140 [Micromonospora sp. NPDC051925]|uniref:hypothetical protein n=1 Tax=Micromonospora sp. NPDC051925 TaxID=3364288 RepID=UPI0037C631E9
MTNDIVAAAAGAAEEDLAWNLAWQSLSVGLNHAREVTRLIRRGQTTSVQTNVLSLAECEFFRVASEVDSRGFVRRGFDRGFGGYSRS